MPYGPQRTIVQRGILKFTEQERKARTLLLISNVTRLPGNEYLNLKFNEPKRYFGNFQVAFNGLITHTGDINYVQQGLWRYEAIANQVMQHVHCVGVNINLNMYAFWQSLRAGGDTGGPDVVPTEIVKPKLLLMDADSVWFNLYNNTTLQVRTYYEPLENLCFLVSPSDWEEPAGEKPTAPSGDDTQPNPQNPDEDNPTDPYDDASDDGGRTYNPTPDPQTGQWFGIYSGFNPGCSTTYSNREFALPGATDPSIVPIVTQTGNGTCGSPAKSGTVTYNGAVVDTPIDYTDYTVVFRAT